MRLVAIPNVSEGRDPARVRACVLAVADAGARVLDVHSDPIHHRSVLTCADDDALVAAMTSLAVVAETDLTNHDGAHPRLGGLDVCPFVPYDAPLSRAVEVAHEAGRSIHETTGLPIYFYGHAALREATRELPDLRKGGLVGLRARALAGLGPDIGSPEIDLRRGVVCVGARTVLIAFNVWLRGSLDIATAVAAEVRTSGGGPPGLRALGLKIDAERVQVSCNLIDPAVTGIEDAFALIAERARSKGADVLATELVGLVPERFMPSADAEAARLLRSPGRSLESVLLV